MLIGDLRCPHCRGLWNDAAHQRLDGDCPGRRMLEDCRIPAGWTFVGMRENRRDPRQVKPHYRTAPGVMRTRITPDMIEAYARAVAQEYGIDGDEAAEAAMYIAYGRRVVANPGVVSEDSHKHRADER